MGVGVSGGQRVSGGGRGSDEGTCLRGTEGGSEYRGEGRAGGWCLRRQWDILDVHGRGRLHNRLNILNDTELYA